MNFCPRAASELWTAQGPLPARSVKKSRAYWGPRLAPRVNKVTRAQENSTGAIAPSLILAGQARALQSVGGTWPARGRGMGGRSAFRGRFEQRCGRSLARSGKIG